MAGGTAELTEMDIWPPAPTIKPPATAPQRSKLLTGRGWLDVVFGVVAGLTSSVVVVVAIFVTVRSLARPPYNIALDCCAAMVIEGMIFGLLYRRCPKFAGALLVSAVVLFSVAMMVSNFPGPPD